MLSFDNLRNQKIRAVSVKLNGQEVHTSFKESEESIIIRLINGVWMKAGEEIQISI